MIFRNYLILDRNSPLKTIIFCLTISSLIRDQKPLGISINNNLSSEEHMTTLCKNHNKKLHAPRISPNISTDKNPVLMKAFITRQFNYCPFVWMCISRSLNKNTNSLHERTLKLEYFDKTSTFTGLLLKDKAFTVSP